jgi:hypothetical protein
MGNSHSGEFSASISHVKSQPITEDFHAATLFFAKVFPSEYRVPIVEVFSSIQPHDVRHMRIHNPRNLARLIVEVRVASCSVCELAEKGVESAYAPWCWRMQAVAIMTQAVEVPNTASYNRAVNAVRNQRSIAAHESINVFLYLPCNVL